MATLNRESIEQEIGKRFEKIEKTLERTLENTLKKALSKAQEIKDSPAGARAQAAAEMAQGKISTARKSLDDVLLGLEHKGYNVKEPQDLIQTVGRRVLERASEIAEDVRSQVAAKPYSPEWLKNVSIPKPTTAAPVKATAVGATEADAALAADGEAQESLEDSKEERAAGTVVHSEPDVVSTSLAEASESDIAADFPAAGKVASKKSSKVSKAKK